MKKDSCEMVHHRLQIGERLKCGEVFIKNIDGYASAYTVECQLCDDRTVCNLTDFLEHIEIWHSDWEDDLHHEEMKEVANEIGASSDEFIQPFEKVLIITEAKATSDLAFSESEENNEISVVFESANEDDNSCNDSLEDSKAIAYTVNVGDILKEKSYLNASFIEQNAENSTEMELRTENFSDISHHSDIDANNSFTNDISTVGENSHDRNKDYFVNIENVMDRSEDSGVEKSEVSSVAASTPQHSTSEDEASSEPRKLSIAETVRLALNEPFPKPKLTSANMEKLIELYENHPRLWQRTHPEYNKLHLCRKSWKEITRTWNRTCKQNFSISDIRVRISTLCQRYLKERKRREMAYEINEPKIDSIISRFRYYDKLKFLDSKENTPYKELTFRLTEEHEKLLEVYSHFPVLWTCRDKHYKSIEVREKAYHDMSTALQLLGIHIPAKMIRQRLTTLRRRYRLEKMRHLHCKLQGKTFEPIFKQYESMKFLDRHIAPFVCETCGKIFRKIQEYQTHIVLKEHEEYEKFSESGESAQASLDSMFYGKCNDESVDFNTELRENDDEMQGQKEIDTSFDHQNSQNKTHNLLKTTSPEELKTYRSFEVENLALIKNPLTDVVLDSPKTNFNLQNDCAAESLAHINIGLGEQTNECNNFINLPMIFQSVGENKNLENLFNGEQFFTLTTNDLGSHLTLNNINTVESTISQRNENNSLPIYVNSINNLNMQTENLITYQVLDNSIEIPVNAQPIVPIELLLNESINDLTISSTPQEGEKYQIVTQYFNENDIIPITTIIDEKSQSSISSETMEISEENSSQHFSMAMNLVETNCNQANAESYVESNRNITIAKDIPKDLVNTYENTDKHQNTSNILTKPEVKNSIGNPLNIKSAEKDGITKTEASKKQKTENEAKPVKSIQSSSEESPTEDEADNVPQQETATTQKLTAKIECGDLQLEIDLSSNQKHREANSEPSLLGRLPREKALQLISLYQDYPELWHPENPSYNSRQLRRNAWRSLTDDLNAKLNTNFNWLQVQRKILDYVKYYRHERRRIQSRRGCTQWSFYDNFDFLDEVMSLPNDLEKRIQQRTQTLKIIEIYEAHPQIWDTTHPDYTKRHQRQRTIGEMCVRLQDVHNLTIEHSKLKQRLLELRKEYRSTKIARVAAQRRKESFEPLLHFEFYDALQFLEDHVPPFNCTECKIEFKCFTDFNLHMKKVHNNLKRFRQPILADEIDKSSNENICHICGIKFTLRHNLLQHLNRHYAGRTLACSVCGKKFFTKSTLMEHERTHSKIPAVICDDCGQTFVNMSKFNQHMKRHKNQRDHECPQCHKLFYTAFDRDSHLRRHLQIRDKFCPFCGKAFVVGSAYYAHLKLHSGKKEYKCTSCEKAFAQYAGLYKHRKRYHPNTEVVSNGES